MKLKLLAVLLSAISSYSFAVDNWDAEVTYSSGAIVDYQGERYESKWSTRGVNPKSSQGADVWIKTDSSASILLEAEFTSPKEGALLSVKRGEMIPVSLAVPKSEQHYPLELYLDQMPLMTFFAPPYFTNLTDLYPGTHQLLAIQRIDGKEKITSVNFSVNYKKGESEQGLVRSNASEFTDLLLGQMREISINTKGVPTEQTVILSINDKNYSFKKPPYALRWVPEKVGSHEFSVRTGQNEDPIFTKIFNVVNQDGFGFCRATKPWKAGMHYDFDSFTEHNGKWFKLNWGRNGYSEPQDTSYSLGQEDWSPVSCGDMVQTTNPNVTVAVIPAEKKPDQNNETTTTSFVTITPTIEYAHSGVKTKNATLYSSGKVIDKKDEPPFTFKYELGSQDQNDMYIIVENTFGIKGKGNVYFNQ